MPLSHPMTREEMLSAVAELDQALYTHEQWTEEIYAVLICHLAPDERDISDEAHRKCRFGQWYYGSGAARLGEHPGFVELEAEHKRLHQCTAALLRLSASEKMISLPEYERFVNALKRTRLEIQTLKRELEVSLYNIDPLTGVAGRMEMLRKLREEHEFVRRGVHPCAIAMLDVDHFKVVNDTYGHAVGDKVLTDIARYLQSHLRPYDLIYRYGGDEFMLCMPDMDLDGGREICDRLRRELSGLAHTTAGGVVFHVMASIGVTELDAKFTVEAAIDRADRALLAAKAAGCNRTVAWTPGQGEPGRAA